MAIQIRADVNRVASRAVSRAHAFVVCVEAVVAIHFAHPELSGGSAARERFRFRNCRSRHWRLPELRQR